MADDLTLRFGAAVSGMAAGIRQANELLDGLNEKAERVNETAATLGEAFGIAFSLEKIKEFIESMGELGEKTERMSQILGVDTAEIGKLDYISKQSGISSQGLSHAIEMLDRNLQRAGSSMTPVSQALKAVGLNAKEVADMPMVDLLGKVADKFQNWENGARKTAIAMALFNRAGAEMIPTLNKGRVGLEELSDQAVNSGAVLSEHMTKSLAEMNSASGKLGSSLTALGITIATALAPGIKKAEDFMSDFISDMVLAINTGAIWERFLLNLRFWWDALALAAGTYAKEAKSALTMDFSGVTAAREEGLKKLDELVESHLLKEKFMIEGQKRLWKDMLKPPPEPEKPKPPSIDTDAIRAAEVAIQGSIKLAEEAFATQNKLIDDQFNQTKSHLAAELAQHKITYDQETAALEDALNKQYHAYGAAHDKMYAVQRDGLAKLVAMFPEHSARWQAELNKLNEANQKYRDDNIKKDAEFLGKREKQNDDATTHDVKLWTTAADQISGAFNSQLSKLLAGQESFAAALKNMSSQIVLKIIEDQVKLSAVWLALRTKDLAVQVMADAGMTASSTSGAAIRAAANTASGNVSVLKTLTDAFTAIGAWAGVTTAAVAANAAPVAGPAAPEIGLAAGTATKTEAIAVMGADIGGYVVQGGLLNVHSGETVVPAAINQPYQGGGGVSPTFNVTALDAASVQKFFQSNASQIARILSSHMNQNPSYSAG